MVSREDLICLKKGVKWFMKKETKRMRTIQLQDGRTFPSIAAFCREFELKYPAVDYHLKQGRSPDEILEVLNQLPSAPRFQSPSGRRSPCSYNGVEYPSILVAAESLGLPAHAIYGRIASKGLDPNDALRDAVENWRPISRPRAPEPETIHRPCKIDGVTYSSKAEALRTYGLGYQTVHSRVRRENISFEEAILRGSDPKRKLRCAEARFPSLSSVLMKPAKRKSSVMESIVDILQKSGYQHILCYTDHLAQTDVIMFPERMEAFGVREILFLFPHKVDGTGDMELEMVIPRLLTVDCSDKDAEIDASMRINELNREIVGARCLLHNGCVQTDWGVTLTTNSINIRILRLSLNRLIAGSVFIYRALKDLEFVPRDTSQPPILRLLPNPKENANQESE